MSNGRSGFIWNVPCYIQCASGFWSALLPLCAPVLQAVVWERASANSLFWDLHRTRFVPEAEGVKSFLFSFFITFISLFSIVVASKAACSDTGLPWMRRLMPMTKALTVWLTRLFSSFGAGYGLVVPLLCSSPLFVCLFFSPFFQSLTRKANSALNSPSSWSLPERSTVSCEPSGLQLSEEAMPFWKQYGGRKDIVWWSLAFLLEMRPLSCSRDLIGIWTTARCLGVLRRELEAPENFWSAPSAASGLWKKNLAKREKKWGETFHLIHGLSLGWMLQYPASWSGTKRFLLFSPFLNHKWFPTLSLGEKGQYHK